MNPFFQAVLAAVASFFIITVLLTGVCILCKAFYKSKSRLKRRHPVLRQINSNLSSLAAGESATFDPSLHRVSMDELIAATSNFAPAGIIGDGGFGLVYKANLANNATVAVKKLSADAFQGFREFRAEMETLGKLRNPNIVKILGYCASGQDRALIYEFIERGSLDQWLHDTLSFEAEEWLGWEARVNVIRGVANGLAYLHGLEKPIIHRDIKASNVLLDSSFHAHIADFGLARRIEVSNYSHVSTQVAGTLGYMPPEYRAGFTNATVKADVYSFGILMFEVATGRRPNLPVVDENGKDVELVEWVKRMLARGQVIEIVDPKLPREELREDEVKELFRIAELCTRVSSRERPVMKEVVQLMNQMCTEIVC
ncbi:hypothetical protein QQ045_000871 [Rhodiola kirilowii]